ncbi:hypothetical protein C7974DRAFT_442811 [Boeremia exigua]|uniref:uncharacterized protein n=1 Tax=Boeremia exigua TaxID=749465 RepID=UPI001E8E08F9|nr:uncharacterized protein C7974DRAFT_442811 [Boeremia exigua]KAH6614799.1 hypothetical protein C7974DRAFT_442811 [Boeremia exigua]
MAITLSDDSSCNDIYTGFWVNQAYGPLRGACLTLSHEVGGLLIAFLALFVTAASSTISMLWASKVWWNRATNARKRTIPVAALGLAVSAKFAAADCGQLQWDNSTDDVNFLSTVAPHISRIVLESSTYAAQYYNQKKGACYMFISQSLPHQANPHASCPFQEKIYTSGIDSVEHLGLNDGPRFTVHHRMHCAPLETKGCTETVTLQGTSSRSLVGYFYGPRDGRNTTFIMEVPTHEKFMKSDEYIMITWEFHLKSSKIISELYHPHADVSLHLLDGFGIQHLQRTEDPWFSATMRPSDRIAGGSDEDLDGIPIFLSDIPGAVVGCASQAYFCNPDLPTDVGCVDQHTQRLGADQETESDVLPSIWPDEKDQTMIRPILSFLSTGLLFKLPTKPSLLARQSLVADAQVAALPVDQWQIEQENYFKASLALMQFTTLDFAKGSWMGGGRFCGSEDHCQRGCHSQAYAPLPNMTAER